MIEQRSYTGSSPQEALKKAKEELGDDFSIITTKQIQEKTLNKKPIFELLVAIEAPEVEPKPQLSANVNEIKRKIEAYTNYGRRQELDSYSSYGKTQEESYVNYGKKQEIEQQNEVFESKEPQNQDVSLTISSAAKEFRRLANIPEDSNADYKVEFDSLKKQINKISETLTILADAVWQTKSDEADLAIPTEFATIYKLAKQSGMKPEHLKSIMQTTIENMPSAMKSNPIAVKRYFYSLLRQMLPCRKEETYSKGQKIIMLVGPTGVGKTTTLAKLAYKYSSKKDKKVGLITIDSYRIGAVEMLFQYASLMKLRIQAVIEPQDFKQAIKNMSTFDCILVDTLGSSQYDQEKLLKLAEFIKESEAEVEVHLVLSASSKVEDLLEIYDNFSFLNIDTLIVTKFDETKIFGNVFSLIYETNTPVSYFSLGQGVPDDIMEADSEFLVKCILDGFQKGVN